jgi:dihydropteroate synthase
VGALSIRVSQSRAERGAAVMGVLNVTPDSFYDGGRYLGADSARARVDALIEAGADIIDIGGESSRPGAPKVPTEEQIERIDAALSHAVARSQLVSVDTTEPAVADYALSRGAACVNDVSCLADSELARVCARHSATLIVMHARGPMQHMAGFSEYPDDAYGDVVEDVLLEWRAARDRAVREGLARESIWLDPGIGFAKNARQSFELLRGLPRLVSEGVPVVVGASRKSFIASVDAAPPEARLGGSIAAALSALARGASVLRVHDVRETRQALLVARRIERAADREVARA